jgi:hypothetical protein
MAIPPQLLMAGASMLGNAFSGGGQAAPAPVNAFTPEMLQQLMKQFGQYEANFNAQSRTPTQGAGGVTTSQGGKLSDREIKQREYAKYLMSKGYDQANAQRLASTTKDLGQDKGFKQWVNKSGEATSLSTKGGKVKSQTEYAPAGFGVSGMSEANRDAMQGLTSEALGAASGLPQMFGMDLARSLQAKQNMGNMAQDYLGQGFTDTGLLASEQAQVDALKNKYLQDFGDLYNDTMRSTAGGLQSSGFASSNLAGEALQRGAYDPQSRFLTDAMASLAGVESNLINQRFGRQSQNLGNILNTFNTLGANQGIGSVLGGIVNPEQAGLATDMQSAQLQAAIQQSALGNAQQNQSMKNQIYSQPVTVMGEQPGFLSNLAAGAAGAAGMYGNLGMIKNMFGNKGTSV